MLWFFPTSVELDSLSNRKARLLLIHNRNLKEKMLRKPLSKIGL